jgi:ABC-2 type transport system ATP-binding protein
VPVISASKLTKRYRRAFAVDNVSFSIGAGEVVGFLGPNGAGKTTTLRMLAGLIRPSSGSAQILDQNVPGATLLDVGTMIEEPSFYPYMSGYDNLRYTALLHGGVDEARIREVLAFVRMEGAADKKLSAYSQGMRQRLGLARALLWRPKVLLLDEPTNGLDPVGIAEIRENLRLVAQGGVTVLISSHILAEIEKLVERVLVIEKGKLLFDGPLHKLTRQLSETEIEYELLATDKLALQNALEAYGYAVVSGNEGFEGLTVRVPQGEADTLLSRLAGNGVHVLEARRREESLESAYLRLVRADSRPS